MQIHDNDISKPMAQQKRIQPDELICMDEQASRYHYRVELAYARADNLLFGEQIYRENSKLWLHHSLADIVCSAAQKCHNQYNLRFVLYDGLRTVDAQEAMMHTQRVQDNPHWLEEPRLLSSPGGGGHPRAMAIDIGLETLTGEEIDMGTAFDYLTENAHPDHNPAHRGYNHTQEILDNRKILDNCMRKAAQELKTELFPLPEEWWDFRLPVHITECYAPLHEHDLPEEMRLM